MNYAAQQMNRLRWKDPAARAAQAEILKGVKEKLPAEVKLAIAKNANAARWANHEKWKCPICGESHDKRMLHKRKKI